MVVASAVTFTLIVFVPTTSDTCRPFFASASGIGMSLPSRYATLALLLVVVGAMVILSTPFATDAA